MCPDNPGGMATGGRDDHAPEWTAFYIDPDDNEHRWRMTGTYWTPERLTPKEAIRKLLPSRLKGPVWAFALAKWHHDGAWYDLHYPAHVERPAGLPEYDRNLGPHAWVPIRYAPKAAGTEDGAAGEVHKQESAGSGGTP